MHALTKLWTALDRQLVLTAVERQWRDSLKEDYDAAHRYFVPEPHLSATYPCGSGFGDECARRVVVHDAEDVAAVCGHAQPLCTTVSISHDDVIAWRFDATRFINEIARLLGCRGPRDACGARGSFALGKLTSVGTPVYFALPTDDGSIDRLLARHGSTPALLLVPLPESLTAAHTQLLAERQWVALYGIDLIARDAHHRLLARDEAMEALLTCAPRTRNAVEPFPTPPGATWPSLTLTFLDGHTFRATIGTETRIYHYGEIGMMDGRSKGPDAQLKVLWNSSESATNTLVFKRRQKQDTQAKQVRKIRQILESIIRIPGESIVRAADGETWMTRFVLRRKDATEGMTDAQKAIAEHKADIAHLQENEQPTGNRRWRPDDG